MATRKSSPSSRADKPAGPKPTSAQAQPRAAHTQPPATRTRRPTTSKRAPRTKPTPQAWRQVARADAIDFRDRWFVPNVAAAPAPALFPRAGLAVKNQGATMACTGFALSLVVEHLLERAGREAPPISPYMLYSMARRYDEFPGSVRDAGSSLRGALKGWFKHGACRMSLFDTIEMPPAADDIADDWWYDAVYRPLGAYYRITPTNLIDMHAALNEVGILYVSCACHSGWDLGSSQPVRKRRPTSFDEVWEIPVKPGSAAHGGHAFAIVGYNERGFLIQNSWGIDWGSHGYALLTYDDWLRHAMDCWIAQLGVVTQDHRELAKSATLRLDAQGRKVALAASEVLRNRELAPFILNMGNNGALSNSGDFRTTPDDVRAIADVQLARARAAWGLQQGTIDVCIFAHGGLVDEAKAAKVAAKWIPMLYEQRIFPVFLMWETGFWSTLLNLLVDCLKGEPRQVGGGLERWWNERLEHALARAGTALWGEMKDNADKISQYRAGVADEAQAGAVLLYRHFKHQVQNKDVRLHFVGHSAGSIVGSLMLDRLANDGMRMATVSYLAPAVRLDLFEQKMLPLLEKGVVQRYQQFALTDLAEQNDDTCGPYRRSLLYLVSRSFEGGVETPILGMERHARDVAKGWPKNTTLQWAPGARSAATTHGGFDDDELTQREVVRFIKGG